jgi:hypothetical protein
VGELERKLERESETGEMENWARDRPLEVRFPMVVA